MDSGTHGRAGRRTGRIILNFALPALAGLAVAVWTDGSDLLGWSKPVVFSVGVLLAAAVAAVQVWRAFVDEAAIATTDDDRNDLRIAMKDSLLPVATLLADLPNRQPADRVQAMQRVTDKSGEVLAHLLLRHVPRIRANVFALNEDNTALVPMSWSGHGDKPGTFLTRFPAGRAAMARVQNGAPPESQGRVRRSARWVFEGRCSLPVVRLRPDPKWRVRLWHGDGRLP